MRPNFGRSGAAAPILKAAVRLMSTHAVPNDLDWDKAVAPMPRVERPLLAEADVERLSERRRVGAELGPFGD